MTMGIMDDSESLLNSVARRLDSSIPHRKHTPIPTNRSHATHRPASRVQKLVIGRNSPAKQSSSLNRSAEKHHSTPPKYTRGVSEVTQNVMSSEPQMMQPGRPRSWHQPPIYLQDDHANCALDWSSSSYPATIYDWSSPKASSDLSSSHSSYPTASPDGMEVYHNRSFNSAVGCDLSQCLDPSESSHLCNGPQPLELSSDEIVPRLDISDHSFHSLYERPLRFDACYGTRKQVTPDLEILQFSFDQGLMSNDNELTDWTSRGPGLFCAEERGPEEELIGLGLYDNAEDAARQNQQLVRQQPAALLSDFFPSTGKGLKLEETWQPPGVGTSTQDVSVAANPSEDCADICCNDEDHEDDQTEDSYFEQQLITPIFNVPLSSFPLDLSEQRFLFGDMDGYAEDVIETPQKPLPVQTSHQHTWIYYSDQIQLM